MEKYIRAFSPDIIFRQPITK